MWRSVQICISLFTLMVGVFVHPELVIKPGLDQMGAAYLILVATLGLSFSIQAIFSDSRPVDLGVRLVLATASLYILFSFNDIASDIVSAGIVAAIGYWVIVRRKLAQPDASEVVVLDPALVAATAVPDAPLGRMN
jgi:hypothetical protein